MNTPRIAWALAMVMGGASLLSAQAPAPARYLTGDMLGAVVVHPKRMSESALLEATPLEVLQAAGLEALKLDPWAIEQAVGGVGITLGGSAPPYGFALRFVEPLTKHGFPDASLEDHLFQRGEAVQANGPTIWQSQRGDPIAFAVVDDHTLLVADSVTRIRRMLDQAQRPPETPLQKALAERESLPDVFVMGDIQSLRPVLGLFLPAIKAELPPEMAGVFDLPMLIRAVVLEADFQESFWLQLTLEANDDQAAQRAATILGQGRAMFEEIAKAELARADDSPDVVEQAAAKYGRRVLDEILDLVVPKPQGPRLVSRIDGDDVVSTVIPISSILVFAAGEQVRAAGQVASSSNQMRLIAIAMLNFTARHGRLPTDIVDANGNKLLSWRVRILPDLEYQGIYDQLRLDEPWDSPHNRQFTSTNLPVFYSPDATNVPPGSTTYLVPAGPGLMFDDGVARRTLDHVTDGTSNTIMLVEVDPAAAVPWAKPGDYRVDRRNPTQGLRLRRDGIVSFVFADGAVHKFDRDTPAETIWSLFTIAGGEVINLDE